MTLLLETPSITFEAGAFAARPTEARGIPRDAVRLLVGSARGVEHASFSDLPAHLAPGDVLVVNTSATEAGEALLRRAAPAAACPPDQAAAGASDPVRSGSVRSFCSWRLDEDERSFLAAGTPVRLTRTEFDIVAALMRHPRKVFTKRELYQAVWHEDAAVEEKAINTHISNIRAKLKGTGTEGYIETVWGIGFKLADEPAV